MLEINYPQFILVPAVYGKAVTRNGFHLSLNTFRVEAFDGLKSHQYIQSPIDISFFTEHKIDVYEDHLPGIKTLNNFMEKCSAFSIHIAQVASIKKLPDYDFDELGKSILDEFVTRAQHAAQQAYSVILDYFSVHIDDYKAREGDYSSLTSEDSEFITVLGEAYQNLLPPNGVHESEEYRATLTLSELEEWNNRLDAVSSKFVIIYYYTLKKEIFNLWHTPPNKT